MGGGNSVPNAWQSLAKLHDKRQVRRAWRLYKLLCGHNCIIAYVAASWSQWRSAL
uniref:Uncharacterized protein n=1 Tax=Kalanchoe fedtschenkoi TaxID=63787 RepID=A0A7N0V1E8_KALFE